ncbi:SCO2400 family protein [Streptomyces albogriseolus]|uniref:SCO2400 family protein n=1 Tax=Streptomyces albogriseolus TaxID=1887 RepID=UPI00345F3059
MAVPCPDRAGRACADARYDTSGRQRMDYCSTCRRHLNGALVCPGCGAYAPDIAPGVADGHRVPGPAATASGTAGAAGAAHRADAERPAETGWFTAPARPDEVARSADTTWPVGAGRPAETPRPAGAASSAGTAQHEETGGPAADAPRALPAGPGTGRAARRRQLARWRKTQRRALVATAVALVGGGITLASTDRGGNDRAQAATAPDLHGMGGTGGTADDPAGAPSAAPDRTTAPPRADGRRGAAPPEAAPTTAPPSRPQTDGAAATEVPAGGRPDAPESVSRSGDRSEASQDTGRDAPDTGDSTTPTRPSSPPPADDDGAGSGDTGGDGGPDQGDGSTAQPAPSTPPPADEPRDPRLCLLVICLG